MDWQIGLSIKNKLLFVIMTVTLIAVGLGAGATLFIELKRHEQNIVDEARMITHTVGAYVAADLASLDKDAARNVLDVWKRNSNIANVHIYNVNGDLFVSLYDTTNPPVHMTTRHIVKFEEQILRVIEPIEVSGAYYGSIYLIMSAERIREEIRHHILVIFTLILCVLLISFFIANKLQSLISGPITKLIEITKQISRQHSCSIRMETGLKGEVGILYKTFNEMVERMGRRELELCQSEEMWRAITEYSPDIIMLLDVKGKILFINKTAPGLNTDDVIGHCTSEYVREQCGKKMLETYQSVLNTGIPHDYEVEYLSPNGVMVYEARVGPVKNNGKITSLIVSARDITGRKMTEAEKARAVKRLQNLRTLDEAILKAHSPQAIARAALENIEELVPCYRSSVTLVDVAKQEIVVLAMRGLDIENIGERMRLALEKNWGSLDQLRKGIVQTIDNVSLLPDPPPLTRMLVGTGVRATLNVPLLAKGEFMGTLNLGANTTGAYKQEQIDIATEIASVLAIAIEQARLTQQVEIHAEQLEQRVAERTAALEAANRELESFSYSVSHDLRTPLRSIDGFSQLLLEDYKDKLNAEGMDYLWRVRNASQRMGKLIDDLLTLSRLNRSAIKRKPVALDKLAQEVISALRETEPSRNVECIVHPNITAYADPQLLRLVLENLLGNAWKFSSRKRRAVIEVGKRTDEDKQDNETTTLFVKDNGAGFDMNYVGKLFGAFQRLHSEEEFEGTGIGLASVQRIIHRHGGEIWANGQVGHGAIFYFTLGP